MELDESYEDRDYRNWLRELKYQAEEDVKEWDKKMNEKTAREEATYRTKKQIKAVLDQLDDWDLEMVLLYAEKRLQTNE